MDIDAIKDNITEELDIHMHKQPYSCTCSECGQDLVCDVTVDGDSDLNIEVEPCPCTKEEE